ncbi:hypothetical protein [Sphingomonas sp. M1A8_2b]
MPARVSYGLCDSATIAYSAATRAITAFGTTIVPGMTGAKLAQTGDRWSTPNLIGTSPATLDLTDRSGNDLPGVIIGRAG